MNSKEIESQKMKRKLTDRQRSIVIGTLLGDGHLETQNDGRTYRLKIEHSIMQRAYVDWVYDALKEFVRTPPKIKKQALLYLGQPRLYKKYWFNTLSSGTWRFYAQQFYRNEKKEVPRLIHRWLTPLAIAVWYMDDGSIKSRAHRAVILNTHAFDQTGLKRLREALLNRYRITTTLRLQKEGQQICITADNADRFLALIEPHIIPSMRYKLPRVWVTNLPKK